MFETLFYQPILNLLIFIYNFVPGHDLGLAIIVLTLVIKLALLPLSKKSIKSQKELQDIQPKVEELKKKYKDNREEMGKKMMELYKENKVNPLSSCLPLLIQLPFLIAVFHVFRKGFENGALDLVYPFITTPATINTVSLGLVDLAQNNFYIALFAGGAQFIQTRMMTTKQPQVKTKGAQDENMMAAMNKQMLYFMPVLTIVIGSTLPGGLTLYWLTVTVFTIIQQWLIFRHKNKQNDLDPATEK